MNINVLETGDSRLSNHYKPSVTTKQLSHPTPSSSLTDDISRYSGDTDEYMPKSKKHCSMKRICKYILWILIFLGISAVVAMLSVNNQNSKANQSVNSMEAQTGNNEINKTLTSVLEKLDSIKKSIESMKTLPEENNTYVNATNNMPYQTSQGYSSTRSGPDSGGPCQKNTTRGCVEFKKCYLMCDGDYQACGPCTAYVTCANRHGWERNSMFGAQTDKGKFVKSSLLKHIEGLKKGRLNRATKEKEKSSPPQDKRIIPVTACELDHSYVSDADGDKVQRVVREEQKVSVEERSARNQWRVGRRVVELETLADGLKGCKLCGQPLQLSEGRLSASFDGAWQKRGNGRAYNSLTGKKCRICAAAKSKGNPHRVHQCCKNWTGSAKAMGPAMACEMLEMVETSGGKLNKKLALSPGLFTTTHTVRLANKLKLKRLQQSQQSMKRRRLKLKSKKLSTDASQSVLEGDTYRSKIGMDDDASDLEDITIVPLKPSSESSSLMYFDLETTGFRRQRTSDIVQIAAVCGEKSLNIYLKANGRISEGASKVTGLTYENGILKRLGQPLLSFIVQGTGLHPVSHIWAFIFSGDGAPEKPSRPTKGLKSSNFDANLSKEGDIFPD
uniref:Mutator-like transposase domain-containing protein n=1 Tax=Magallana gigas TaxID=29159 RepID=K1P7T1_MAGGI